MIASATHPQTKARSWLPWLVILAYTAFRLALLPPDDISIGGFAHDSAYLAKVSENLLVGRGYVNDALWLVFLQPEALPMPYHNANPLYPTLVAGISWLTGLSVVTAGFVISALASSGIMAAVVVLVSRYHSSPWLQTWFALAGALVSSVFEDSLNYVPDALCLALLAGFWACLVRRERMGWTVLGGVLFGLAWLSRSSAVLMLPALVVYLLLAHGWKKMLIHLVVLGGVAGLVALPWLIHTAQVWGNPLRSDASYYLWEEYHARAFAGDRERYWHSPNAPPSLGELLRREPGSVIIFYLRSLPLELRRLLAGWSYGNYPVAALLAVLGLYAGYRLLSWYMQDPSDRPLYRPMLAAALAFAATALLAFAPRAISLEKRYLSPLSLLFALLLAWGTFQALQGLRAGRLGRRILSLCMVLLYAVFWLGVVPYRDVKMFYQETHPNPDRAAYVNLVQQVDAHYGKGGTVVAGTQPYFYPLATGAQALSIPESDDYYLREYMKRYHARYVVLTREELAFWRPQWQQPGGLPPWLELAADLGTASVFKRKDDP